MLDLQEWTKYYFTDDLKVDIENVAKIYKIYKNDEDNESKYNDLKQAIYDLSFTIKHEVVNREISPVVADEMRDFFLELLL